MASVNSSLLAASLRHQIGLRRVEARTVREIISLLNEADRDIMAQIEARLIKMSARGGLDTGPYTTRRLEAMLGDVRAMNRAAYERLGRFLRKDLKSLAEYEAEFSEQSLADSVGGKLKRASVAEIKVGTSGLSVKLVEPPLNQIVAAIDSNPFSGDIMKNWITKLEGDQIGRIRQALNLGIAEGQGVDQMVRRLRGTRAAGYTDGVLDISRRHAETWVRTYVNGVANVARDSVYEANADILEGVTWISTLDDRTCPRCVPPDGKLYSLPDHKPVGHSVPWGAGPGRLHPADRCTSAASVKPYRKLGIDMDKVEDPSEMRAAMGGPVSRSTTAEDWLRSHPEAARSLYGKERAELFLRGGVSADDLIKSDGTMWTLADLREREAEAFKKIAA